MVALKVCLRQLQISTHFGLKSRQSNLILSQKSGKTCFHFQNPNFVKQSFLQRQQPKQGYRVDWTGAAHSGVTHITPDMWSNGRKTTSGIQLLLQLWKVVKVCHYTFPHNDNTTNKIHSIYNVLKSSQNHSHPPLIHKGKTVFCETVAWCQKGDNCFLEIWAAGPRDSGAGRGCTHWPCTTSPQNSVTSHSSGQNFKLKIQSVVSIAYTFFHTTEKFKNLQVKTLWDMDSLLIHGQEWINYQKSK